MALRTDDLNRLLFLTEQSRRAWISQNLQACGISHGQWVVLDALAREGPSNMTSLARTVGGDRTTLTRTIDGLVAADLVVRHTRPDDRRNVVVALTEPGVTLIRKANAVLAAPHAAMFTRMAGEDQAQLGVALATVYAELQRLLSEEPTPTTVAGRSGARTLRRAV